MEKVLFVDDDPNLLAGVRRTFYRSYKVDCAEGAHEALSKLDDGTKYSVIVSDMRMPEMNGVEFFSKVASKFPEPIRIMLTGNNDQKTAIDAVNVGHIFSFLNKPCGNEELGAAIEAAVEQFRLKSLERDLLERTLAGSVKVLLDVMRYTNPLAFGRTCAIRELAVEIARDLGARNLWQIKIAAMLSTIGWMSVPDHIVEKVVRRVVLDADERELVENQTEVAFSLLKSVPRLEDVAEIIRYQNKNYDGTGFPSEGPTGGEDIPLGSRILKVLNAVTPLNKPKRPTHADLEELPLDGLTYDPAVVLVARQILADDQKRAGDPDTVNLEVTARRLMAGDVLEEDLVGADRSLLLSAGNELSEFHIAKLRQNAKFAGITDLVHIKRTIS